MLCWTVQTKCVCKFLRHLRKLRSFVEEEDEGFDFANITIGHEFGNNLEIFYDSDAMSYHSSQFTDLVLCFVFNLCGMNIDWSQ